jgi:amidase
MCRTVADTALMFGAMTDHASAAQYDPDAPLPVSSLRVGVLRAGTPMCDVATDPEIQTAFGSAVSVLRSLVADVRHVADLPMPELGRLIEAGIYSYHARQIETSPERYDARTRKMILDGRDIPAGEADRLRKALARYRASVPAVFTDLDLVVIPTLPVLPLRIEEAREPFSLPACTLRSALEGGLRCPCPAASPARGFQSGS